MGTAFPRVRAAHGAGAAIFAAVLLELSGVGQLATAQVISGNQAASAQHVPFTAEFKITRVQTLADGTTITHETREVVARDSESRRMTATTPIREPGSQPASTMVHVNDPADGTRISWNTTNKQVQVVKMPVPGQMQGCWTTSPANATAMIGKLSPPSPPPGGQIPPAAARSGGGGAGSGSFEVLSSSPGGAPLQAGRPDRPQIAREDLGVDTIGGVQAHGYRTTRTTPAGTIGNDQPLVHVDESWSAPSLGLTLRQMTQDPQMGTTTRELVSLDLNEPDPSVFQPPVDYEVINEEMHQVPCAQTP